MAEDSSNREKLAAAMDTIAEVLVGEEIESVRGTIAEMDSALSTRITSVTENAAEAIDRFRNEITARIDELVRNLEEMQTRQKTVLAELEERTRQALDEARSKADERIETVKNQLSQDLAKKEETLMKELDGVAKGLSAVQLELQQQMETTERTSSVLDNLATVFSARAAAPAPAEETASPPPAEPVNEENLDSALDRVFPGDAPSS